MTDIARKTAAQTELLRIAVRNNAGPLILQKHIDDGADVNAPMFNGESATPEEAKITIKTRIEGVPIYKGKIRFPAAVASTAITDTTKNAAAPNAAAPSAKWSFGLGKAVQNLFGIIGKAVQNFFGINRDKAKQSDAAPQKTVEEELFAAIIAMKDNDINKQKVADLISKANLMWTNHRRENALHIAAEVGNTFAIGLLLAKEPALVAQKGETGNTPLHLAIKNIKEKAIRLLVAASSDLSINMQDAFGNTPLNLAVTKYLQLDGAKDLITAFLEKGSDTSIENSNGYTPDDLIGMVCIPGWHQVGFQRAVDKSEIDEVQLMLRQKKAQELQDRLHLPVARPSGMLPQFNTALQVTPSAPPLPVELLPKGPSYPGSPK